MKFILKTLLLFLSISFFNVLSAQGGPIDPDISEKGHLSIGDLDGDAAPPASNPCFLDRYIYFTFRTAVPLTFGPDSDYNIVFFDHASYDPTLSETIGSYTITSENEPTIVEGESILDGDECIYYEYSGFAEYSLASICGGDEGSGSFFLMAVIRNGDEPLHLSNPELNDGEGCVALETAEGEAHDILHTYDDDVNSASLMVPFEVHYECCIVDPHDGQPTNLPNEESRSSSSMMNNSLASFSELQYQIAINNEKTEDVNVLKNKITRTSKNEITVYPNPISNTLYLSNVIEGDKVTLFNFAGQKILSILVQSNDQKLEVNTENIVSGVYHIMIENSNRSNSLIERVIKQ